MASNLIGRTSSALMSQKQKILKEGWLKKKMQKRYFVLDGTSLSWFEQPLVNGNEAIWFAIDFKKVKNKIQTFFLQKSFKQQCREKLRVALMLEDIK